jgi:tetratricopeptide (TPR) repeat protein
VTARRSCGTRRPPPVGPPGWHRTARRPQFERALRFAGGADAATLAGLHEGLADEVSLLDRWQDAESAEERALSLWREAGDRLREGDALRRLSRIRWNMCRGRDAVAAVQAAVSTLEPLGPSVELAWAYATFANQRMLYADHDAAIDLARRAQELAARFDATDVLSDALNTQAASASAKDLDWIGQMHRALSIALSNRHQDQAARAYTNLCGIHAEKRQFAEANRHLAEGIAYCDEHDITTYAMCLRGERANLLERTGCWDEAIALSLELLIKAGPSPANRLCALIRLGAMRARRGEAGVWECLDEAAATADETGEPQQQVPVRLARAEAYWLGGNRTRRCARRSRPTTRPPTPMPGSGARSRSGYGAPGPRARRAARSPSRTGCCSAATRRRPPGAGPAWAAPTTRRWRWPTHRTSRPCGRP